jgi:hypothetical protein
MSSLTRASSLALGVIDWGRVDNGGLGPQTPAWARAAAQERLAQSLALFRSWQAYSLPNGQHGTRLRGACCRTDVDEG